MGIIQSAVETLGGLALQRHNDRRQIRQQKKLNAIEIAGEKELGNFNQQLALDMWNKTNYDAQVKQLQKAGLNVGLMYDGGGAGGTTAGGSAGNVTGGSAPTGGGEVGMMLQMGLQREMQKATIEATKAATEKTKVETQKIAGVDTEHVTAGIENLKQSTQNAKVQEAILEYEKQIKEVEKNIQNQTQYDLISQIQASRDILIQQAKQAEGLTDEVIKQAQQTTTEQQLRMSAIKQGIEVDQKAIQKMSQEIVNMNETNRKQWREWEQGEKERWIKEKALELQKQQIEFNTSDPATIRQWTSIITDILKAQ